MDAVLLTARVSWNEGGYLAKVDQLPLEGAGASVDAAKEAQIEVGRTWIQDHDGTDGLSQTMADAGFLGVEEDTEVQLEFMD